MTPVIIVPSFNGADCLPNLIRALEVQTYPDFNTIIVLDGSTDESAAVIEGMDSRLNIKVIEQENKGRSGARNSGAKHAQGDLLIFLDDDIRPASNFVEQHVNHHEAYRGSALTGRVQSDPEIASTDFQRYLANRTGRWMDTISHEKIQLKRENLFFTAANCSIPRHLFNELNGFDESLSDAEDFELGTRILKKNIPVYFDYNCFGWHDDFVDLKQYILRQREYLNAWIRASKSKPHLITDYNRFDLKVPQGFRGFFFKLFAHTWWLKWSGKQSFRILPRGFRYRLIDYIVISLGRYNTHVEIK